MLKRSSKPRALNEPPSTEDEATDETPESEHAGKDPAAVELGRRGGLKGGRARAQKLTAERRTAIARKAAEARWRKD